MKYMNRGFRVGSAVPADRLYAFRLWRPIPRLRDRWITPGGPPVASKGNRFLFAGYHCIPPPELFRLVVNLNTSINPNPISRTKETFLSTNGIPQGGSTNKTETLAVSLILWCKIKFTAKYSFVFIRVISGQPFPGFPFAPSAPFALNIPGFHSSSAINPF